MRLLIRWAILACLCDSGLNAAITITSSLQSYATLNNPIQGVLLQATGATTPLQWSISAGSLPPGLTLTAGGLFSGTPSAAGTYNFTIRAAAPQEPNNTPGAKSFTIGIPQIINASPLPPATVGVPYSVPFVATDGPSSGALWSVTLGGLPIGLTINPQTGVYGGTPTRTGTFNPLIAVGYGVANATKQFLLTINAATQTLVVSPSALQFTGTVGDIKGLQNLAVTSTAAAPIAFTVQVDDGRGGPAPPWLKVTPQGGTTPALLRTLLVNSNLPPGSYAARIRVSQVVGGLPPIDIPVGLNLTVSNLPPFLIASPALLRLRARVAGPGVQEQTFLLSSLGGATIPFSLAVVGKSPWITRLDSAPQAAQAGNPATVKVTINTQGLGAGIFTDTIRVTTQLASPFDQLDIPVSLAIADQGAVMSLSQTGVRFATIQGNQNSRTQQILVENIGDPGSTVNWTADAIRGAEFVTLTDGRGSSTTTAASSFSVRLSNAAAASAGGMFALIQVSDPQSQNAPQYVVVVADVATPGTAPIPDPDPGGLTFVVAPGGSAPPAQQITVNTPSNDPVTFFATASTDDGANWLSATTNSSTTSQTNAARVSVAIAPGSLKPGVYTGAVNIGIGAIVRAVIVTAIVQGPGAIAAKETSQASPNCTANAVVLAQAGLTDNFSVPAGWPTSLAAQVADNCGNSLKNASVTASFSNGDAAISLRSAGQSNVYSATWQPTHAVQGMTVTIDGSSGSLTPAQIKAAGNVDSNSRPAPSLAPGGLLNNLNPQAGAPLAPGTVTQVYGENLADAPDTSSVVPLPTTLKTVQTLVGGITAPFFYVSKNQLVIQLPSELAPKRTHLALVLAGDQYTLPQEIDVAPVTPGTVAFADGTLVAQHSDFKLVDASRPARPGEPLTIYLVGMGATNPAVQSGRASPSSPLAQVTSRVQVTVDGLPADVSFAGLTPGGVGLYQINFTVPSAAKTGSLEVIITQDDVKANTTRLLVAQ